MLEIILIVFGIILVWKFLTMEITWLRVGIIGFFIGFGLYVQSVAAAGVVS